MTLLTIAAALAKNVGLAVPDQVVLSSQRQWSEALQMANEAGEELARRVDWGELRASTTLTGTGANETYTLPAGFSRISPGVGVRAGSSIVRPLTRAEWNILTPVQGTPRYFLLEGNKITLWPFLANGQTATVSYQSKEWASTGSTFTADDATALIDEGLLTKGLIVRWRRQKRMTFQDEEAEYEAALQNFARFNDRGRL
jgi:hypothetical protein